ncbi:MAG: 50S ribosomal protein L11 methyltransferase [Phyllobacterium sp.]
MTQTRLFITTSKDEADRIYTILEPEFEDDGFPIANVEIDEDDQIFEVSVYVEDDVDAVSKRIASRLAENALNHDIGQEELPDIDWVTHSLEGLSPVRAGRFFVHGSHDRDKRRVNDLGIEIDAGLAFGTGHHGTTAGCLEMISEVIRREKPRNALDLGTGSAVLAIGIAKLSPIPVLATDIDPIATAVAQDNVVKNGVAARIHTATATGFHHPVMQKSAPYDLIVANILARPLMHLAPAMRNHLARGGSLILSGILDSQRDKVLAAYRIQGLYHVKTLHRSGWVTIHLKAADRP